MIALLPAHVLRRVFAATLALAFALACASAGAAPNKAPTVTLIAPTNGASFTAPATITLTANATDSDGAVAKVDFYRGTTLIGTRTAVPYSITWSNVPAGSYSLTAKATDDRGSTKTSTAVGITVSGAKVIITAPASGATLYTGSALVTGTFSGDSNTTVLVDNGNTTRVAALDGSNFSATIPVHIGANTLRVVVNRRDKTSDQASVNVTGNGSPLLVFTAPATTTFDAPADVSFVVDAVSPAGTMGKVDFYRNGTLFGSASAPPYQQTWTNVPAGSHTVMASATDALGATGTTFLDITVNGPNVPPVVTLTTPAGGTTYTAPASIAMAASATDADGAVALVEFLQNGNVVGTTNVPPYALTWNGVPVGTYALTARATDNRSAVTTSTPVNITVGAPNVPPAVALTSPAAWTTYTAPANLVLSATATDSDGSVSRVEFYAGTTLIGTVTAPPWSVAWSGVGPGEYSLTAKAVDNAGASATSAPVTVSVNAPAFVIASPVNGATIDSDSVSVWGTVSAPPNSGITVNGKVAALYATGHFYASQVPLVTGANTISVTVTTLDGYTATQSVTVTSTGPAPVHISASPTQGLEPLEVTFEVIPADGVTIQNVEYDFTGDGSFDRTLVGEPWGLVVTYQGTGVAMATIRVTDAQGMTYSETIPIVLADAAALDQTLRGVWSGMTNALASGDKEGALRHLDTTARQTHGRVFDALLPYMPQIVPSFSAPQPVSLSYGLGEYAVNRVIDAENRIFLIYFNLGGDGVWRVGSM
jgi:hypothetical protein